MGKVRAGSRKSYRQSLELLAAALRRDANLLGRAASFLPAHLHNMLYLSEGDGQAVGFLLERAEQALGATPWLKLANRPKTGRPQEALLRVLGPPGAGAVAWSSQDRLATASRSGIRLWDPRSGQLVAEIGIENASNLLEWSPGGALLAATDKAGSPKVWVIDAGGGVRHGFGSDEAEIRTLAWSPDGKRLASGAGRSVRIWNAETGDCDAELDGDGTVRALAWAPDARAVASAASPMSVRLWDVGEASLLADADTAPGHATVTTLAWSPDGRLVCGGTLNGTILIWDAGTGVFLAILKMELEWSAEEHLADPMRILLRGRSGEVAALAWSTGGSLAWASDRRVYLRDRPGGTRRLGGHQGTVEALAWSPDGSALATSTWQETTIWTPPKKRSSATLLGDRIRGLAWSPYSDALATAEPEAIRLWDPWAKARRGDPRRHRYPVEDLGWSPDGALLHSVGENDDHTIRTWDGLTGEAVATLSGHGVPVTCALWSPDGTRLASASGATDQSVRVWDPGSGDELACMRWHSRESGWERKWVNGLGWSSDGRSIALGTSDGTVFVWHEGERNGFAQTALLTDATGPLAWSPRESHLATAGRRCALRLWDSEVAEIAALDADLERVYAVAWSPDSEFLAAQDEFGAVAVWKVGTGDLLQKLGGDGNAGTLHFSADGSWLASLGTFWRGSKQLHKTRCWNTTSWERVALHPEPENARALAFAPCGRWLAVGDGRAAGVWSLASGARAAVAFCRSPVRAVQYSSDGRVLRVADSGAATGNRPVPYVLELRDL
jgi:WD40 repeat protein